MVAERSAQHPFPQILQLLIILDIVVAGVICFCFWLVFCVLLVDLDVDFNLWERYAGKSSRPFFSLSICFNTTRCPYVYCAVLSTCRQRIQANKEYKAIRHWDENVLQRTSAERVCKSKNPSPRSLLEKNFLL